MGLHRLTQAISQSPQILELVNNVPVNYAIRFSGPVAALTAPSRVRHGVRAGEHRNQISFHLL
jgi:hypothetical protein